MRPDHRPTPTQIIGELLRNHPEAASLLFRATQRRSLAVWSAARARRKFAAAQAARLAYEELGHLSAGPYPAWSDVDRRAIFGALTGAFILVLTAGAAALMAHLEPARLLVARRRWYRARAAYKEAAETVPADAQAAAVARESWLGLVRARVITIAPDDDHLIEATVARAAALVGNDRPQLPSSE